MQNKFYRMLFPNYIYFIAIAALLIAGTSLTLNILKIFNITGYFRPLVDIIAMIIALLIIAAVIFCLVKSGFYFKKDRLHYQLSLFSIQVPYCDVLLLRHDPKADMLLFYYNQPLKDNIENIKFFIVNISPKFYEDFIKDVKKNSPQSIYEIFDKNRPEE